MLQNYLRVAIRNFLRNRTSSFINIGGLAIGMAVALLIGLWIGDELSYNKNFPHYNRIAQVMQHQTLNGVVGTAYGVPIPLAGELATTYKHDFTYIVPTSWKDDHILRLGEKSFSSRGMYMGDQAPALLSLDMLQGSRAGLMEPNSILLSASMAKAIFGSGQVLDQILRIDNKLPVKVTGVYQDLPANCEFGDLAFIAPWQLYLTSENWIRQSEQSWDQNSFRLYVQIADHTDFSLVNKDIVLSKYNRVDASQKKFRAKIFLHPMQDWHLRSHWEDGVQTGGAITYVRLFSIVGIFVLLLACINFMNLSTARSEKRAKEVGIRKSIGSLRGQLVAQFYWESLLVVALAFVVSLLLVQLALPGFNQLSGKEIHMPWTSLLFWGCGLGFGLLTGIIAGSYPAWYLSSFDAVKVLKGTFRVGPQASLPRKVLVVVQFTVSLALIIGTIVVYRQIQYTKNRPIGYDGNNLMMVKMKSPDFYGKFDLLRTELKGSGVIEELAESSSPLNDVYYNMGGFYWPEKDPAQDADFGVIWVTHEFGKTVGWQVDKGRDFSRELKSDSSAIILNEAAVQFMGLKQPLGSIVRQGQGAKAKNFTVVGVVKNLLLESPYAAVRPAIFFLDYENANFIDLKLNPNRSAAASIAAIRAAFAKYIPSAPFEYEFADRDFSDKFMAEERVGRLAAVFAALAVFISCLGLFGLAVFVAEQRTKEVGIRKVLGASVLSLWGLLSKEFLILIGISFLLSIPATLFFMGQWLQQFAYRTGLSWWIYLAAGVIVLLLTILTVSYQAIKAALANPAKSLKTE